MKLTNLDLVGLYNKLIEQKETSFPARVSFIIARNEKKIWDILQDYLNAKNKAIENYCTPVDGEPGKFALPPQDSPYWEEMKELDNTENEIEFKKFYIDDLKDMELSLEVMNALLPMIEEETE